jgi:multimeric flavodoxin WrbA
LEVESFRAARMDIRPCRACNACFKEGECIQQDDMQEIYPHLTDAAAVAMAAPIFSMNICAQAKALIDRCQRFWSTRYVLNKSLVEPDFEASRRGIFISCCGRDIEKTFECTRPTMAYFFHIIQVPVWDTLTYAGVDEIRDILKVEGALDGARRKGESLANQYRLRPCKLGAQGAAYLEVKASKSVADSQSSGRSSRIFERRISVI